MSNLELFSIISTAICVFLAGRNSVHTWWVGIVACISYGFLFYQNQLYADMLLQGFFVVTGVIGWYMWATVKSIKPIRFEPYTWHRYLWMTIAVIVAFAYGTMLHSYTDAFLPFVDSFVLTLSVLGQITLMRRTVESWYLWVVVNIISIPMYISRGLNGTAMLYGFFLIHAIITAVQWYGIAKTAENEKV
jgi:nicotinamide mononucleotide transporter